jgi:hydroxypyruvate reductase
MMYSAPATDDIARLSQKYSMLLPHVLAVSKLPITLTSALNRICVLHEQIHETDPEIFAALALTIRGVVVGGKFKLTEKLISLLPALEVISVVGAGYDGVDVAAALARGILVTHTPEIHAQDVADFAMALILSLGRRIPEADRFVREGQWLKGYMSFSSSIGGRRLGLLGMGSVGVAIAHRASAFNLSVTYTSRSPKNHLPYRYFDSLIGLASHVEFLLIAAPGGASTRHIVNANILQALGSKGFLINVSRGSLVDQTALINALNAGVIAGAALDVFDGEPKVDEAFIAMNNVILTPHIASSTHTTRQAMFDLTVANLQWHFEGKRPPHLIPECL